MKNPVKAKIENGEKVIGTFFQLGSNTAVECLGISGLDFFIIDTEHGPFDIETSIDFVRTAEVRNITPLPESKIYPVHRYLKCLISVPGDLLCPVSTP